jgi:hypothetical protein
MLVALANLDAILCTGGLWHIMKYLRVIKIPALLAVSGFLWLGAPASAQNAPAQDNSGVQNQNPGPNNNAMRQDQMDDITRQELLRFDQFLDEHRQINDELRRDPSLVDNQDYLQRHPELQQYLQDHPRVSEAITQHPDAFMRDEVRIERRQDDRDRGMNRNGEINREEITRFNEFLDSHREIAEQLRRNPQLVDDRNFVEQHPPLQMYLKDHPEIREQIKQNPNAFLRDDERYDRRDDDRDRASREELARFDQFLDSHREIAEQLRKDPSLVDNREFLSTHPALQSFLQDHPGIREQIKDNPTAFMREEDRFDQRDERMGRDDAHDRSMRFGEFLGSHGQLSDQLGRDPTLVRNEEFMANHPELRDYLKDHPDVQKDLMANPQDFVRSAQQFSNGSGVKSPTSTPNSTPMPDKPKQ